MANRQRGFYTVMIGGKQRTLHFSMNFWAAFTDELGIGLADIDSVFTRALDLKTIRAIVYSGILANDQENGNIIDYNVYTVGSWLEDITPEILADMLQCLTETKLLGNDLNGGISRGAVKTTKETAKKKTQLG